VAQALRQVGRSDLLVAPDSHITGLYFIGQVISTSGTDANDRPGVARAPADQLGHGLGLVTALQSLPVLLGRRRRGVLADRFPSAECWYYPVGSSAILALTLGTLVATGVVRLWMVGRAGLCLWPD